MTDVKHLHRTGLACPHSSPMSHDVPILHACPRIHHRLPHSPWCPRISLDVITPLPGLLYRVRVHLQLVSVLAFSFMASSRPLLCPRILLGVLTSSSMLSDSSPWVVTPIILCTFLSSSGKPSFYDFNINIRAWQWKHLFSHRVSKAIY